MTKHADTDINEIMTLIQEFASEWSLVGGRFDDGTMIEKADASKARLRAIIESKKCQEPAAYQAYLGSIGWAEVNPESFAAYELAGYKVRMLYDCAPLSKNEIAIAKAALDVAANFVDPLDWPLARRIRNIDPQMIIDGMML